MPSNTINQRPNNLIRTDARTIFFIAFTLRMIYFLWSQASPFLYQLSTDEAFYVDYARHILRGEFFPYAHFMDPLFAYVLAVPLHFFTNLHIVRLLFLLFDCLNAVLLFRVCFALTEHRAMAIMAGVLYSLASSLVIYSVFFTKSTPIIFCLLLHTLWIVEGFKYQHKKHFFGAGFIIGIGFFFGAVFILLVMAQALLIIFTRQVRQFCWIYFTGLFSAIFLCSILLGVVTTPQKILPSNGGIIFYISNHAANERGTHLTPGFVKERRQESTPVGIYQAFTQQAKMNNPHIKNDADVSHYWFEKALLENIAYPEKALIRLKYKLLNLINNAEISQNYYFPYIKEVTLRNVPLLPFSVFFSFGVAGFLFFSKKEDQLEIILLPILIVVFGCLVFFVSERMRVAALPFLMLGVCFWLRCKQFANGKILSALLVTLFLNVVSQKAVTNPIDVVEDKYNLAVVMMNAKMYAESTELIDEILKTNKSSKNVFLKAVLLSQQGKCDAALVLYQQIYLQDSTYPGLSQNMSICKKYLEELRIK